MAVNYSAYPATGYDALLTTVKTRDSVALYEASGGFGGKIDKRIALSSTKYHLSGGTYYYPSVSDITNANDGSIQFAFNPPLNKNNTVYNILTGTDTATTKNDGAIHGYNTTSFTYPTLTAAYRNTLWGTAVNYLSDYEPARFVSMILNSELPFGLDGKRQNFALAWLNMENLDAHWWSTSFGNTLMNEQLLYNTSEKVNPYEDFTGYILDTNKPFKMTRCIDNNFNLSLFTRSWKGSYYRITYDAENGNKMSVSVTAPTGNSFSRADYFAFGNIPSIKQFAPLSVFKSLFGELDTYAGYSCLYFNGEFYKVDENGKLVNSIGVEISGDVEQGALWLECVNMTTFNLRSCQHIKSVLKAHCSYGLPVRTCQSYRYTNALTSMNPQYPEVSQYYQTKINTRTGEVKGEPLPLYVPENLQSIVNPDDIDITFSDNIPIIETPLEVPEVFYIANGIRTYAMGQGDFNTLMQKLYELPADIFELVKGFNENISESIRNVTVFPFNIVNYFQTSTVNLVYYGTELLDGINELHRSNCIINMGNFIVEGDGTFMDYEPYTQYYIYLPYVGIRKLDSRDVVGVPINVRYIVDAQTGECRANIFRSGVLIAIYNGVCGINIPIVSRDYSTLMANVNNMIASFQKTAEHPLATLGRAVSEGGYLGKGDPFSAGFTVVSAMPTPSSVAGAVTSTNIYRSSVAMSGEAGTTSAFTLPQYPYIIKVRSRYELPDNYGHSVGYVCEESGKLSEYKGFTVCDNVDLSGIPCLETEKNMIKSLLHSGVYL